MNIAGKLGYIFLKIIGWEVSREVFPESKRAVMIAAPHTSGWDVFIGMAGFRYLGIKTRFAIKGELMKFPYNLLFGTLGGIGIDRYSMDGTSKRAGQVFQLSSLFSKEKELTLFLAPEGTRQPVQNWKKGFYYIALQANVPIVLCYLDHVNKKAGMGKLLYPSGDIDKDMKEIMDYYKTIPLKYPERFSLDTRYQ